MNTVSLSSFEQKMFTKVVKFVKSVNLEDAFISVRQLFIDKWLKPNIETITKNFFIKTSPSCKRIKQIFRKDKK